VRRARRYETKARPALAPRRSAKTGIRVGSACRPEEQRSIISCCWDDWFVLAATRRTAGDWAPRAHGGSAQEGAAPTASLPRLAPGCGRTRGGVCLRAPASASSPTPTTCSLGLVPGQAGTPDPRLMLHPSLKYCRLTADASCLHRVSVIGSQIFCSSPVAVERSGSRHSHPYRRAAGTPTPVSVCTGARRDASSLARAAVERHQARAPVQASRPWLPSVRDLASLPRFNSSGFARSRASSNPTARGPDGRRLWRAQVSRHFSRDLGALAGILTGRIPDRQEAQGAGRTVGVRDHDELAGPSSDPERALADDDDHEQRQRHHRPQHWASFVEPIIAALLLDSLQIGPYCFCCWA
jgi:hypothetical protein